VLDEELHRRVAGEDKLTRQQKVREAAGSGPKSTMQQSSFSTGLKAVLDRHGYGFQYAVLNKCRESFDHDQGSPWALGSGRLGRRWATPMRGAPCCRGGESSAAAARFHDHASSRLGSWPQPRSDSRGSALGELGGHSARIETAARAVLV
jgi:hypothetical protein